MTYLDYLKPDERKRFEVLSRNADVIEWKRLMKRGQMRHYRDNHQ